MKLPLEGIKVLDLSTMLPGPLCTMIMADFGAEVIRVEPTKGGDLWRNSLPLVNGLGHPYMQVNRNKKSMDLNLKSDEGKAIFYRMVKDADVVIEQYRPGVADRLGIGYQKIREINPKIVYCSLSGYGQDGPYSQKAGHDINYVSYAGILGLTVRKGQVPTIPSVQIADIGGGALYAAISILIALRGVDQNGTGQYIDVSMLDGAMSWMPFLASSYLANGVAMEPNGNILIGQLACYEVYETKDGRFLSLGSVELHLWEKFCELIGKPEYVAWQRDVSRQPEMFAYLRELFKSKSLAEWCEILADVDCCWSPVQTIDEGVEDPQVRHRGMVVELTDPQGEYGTVKVLGSPIKLSDTPAKKGVFPPRKGEHTRECLKSCGYSDEEIAVFEANGVV